MGLPSHRSITLTGQIYNVFTGESFPGSIEFASGHIRAITRLSEAPPQIITVGFVCGHVHVESSLVTSYDFAIAALIRGVIGAVADPHEIGNVLGIRGVRHLIELGTQAPFYFAWGASPCVPATTFETAGASIELEDIKPVRHLFSHVAEVMNFPGVIAGDSRLTQWLEFADEVGWGCDAHAPGVTGEHARIYFDRLKRSGRPAADHECTTYAEGLEKLELGAIVAIRNGSAAKDFEALIDLLPEYPDRIFFCADDAHPDFILDLGNCGANAGYIDSMVRRAIARGIDPMVVLRAASRNPILHYNLPIGRMNVGDSADLIVLENFETCRVLQTYVRGELVAEQGQTLLNRVPVECINHFDCEPVTLNELRIPAVTERIRAMVVDAGKLVTRSKLEPANIVDGYLESSVERDLLKLVVKNRYRQTGLAKAIVHGLGLKQGAIASSVAHDSHNIVAAGANDVDLARAVNLVIENQGALVLVDGDFELALPLPVAGLMSDKSVFEVAKLYADLDAASKDRLGSILPAPFMALSFLALLVIPEFKLSDLGPFDGVEFAMTSLFV